MDRHRTEPCISVEREDGPGPITTPGIIEYPKQYLVYRRNPPNSSAIIKYAGSPYPVSFHMLN